MAERLNNKEQQPELKLDELTNEQIEAVRDASDWTEDTYGSKMEREQALRFYVGEALVDTGIDNGEEIARKVPNIDSFVIDVIDEGLGRHKNAAELEADSDELERLESIVDAVENPAKESEEDQSEESFKVTYKTPRLARRAAIQDALRGSEYEIDPSGDEIYDAEGKFEEVKARIEQIKSKHDTGTEDEPHQGGHQVEVTAEGEGSESVDVKVDSVESDTEAPATRETVIDSANSLIDQIENGEPGVMYEDDTKKLLDKLINDASSFVESGEIDTSEEGTDSGSDMEKDPLEDVDSESRITAMYELADFIKKERQKLNHAQAKSELGLDEDDLAEGGESAGDIAKLNRLIEESEDELQGLLNEFNQNSNKDSTERKRITEKIIDRSGAYEGESESSEEESPEKKAEKESRFARLKRKMGITAVGAALAKIGNKVDLKVHEGLVALGGAWRSAREQRMGESLQDYEERKRDYGFITTTAAVGGIAVLAFGRQQGWFDGIPDFFSEGGGLGGPGGEGGSPEVIPGPEAELPDSESGPDSREGLESELDKPGSGTEESPSSETDSGESLPVVDPETEEKIRTIQDGEGWHQTLLDMGVSQEEWDLILMDAKDSLLELGIAYEGDPDVLGKAGIGISHPGRMPQHAIDAIIDSANNLGIDIKAEVLHSRHS